MKPQKAILGAAFFLLAGPAQAAEIFRCTAPGGAVSYQETPCPDPSTARTLDVPAVYPAIDSQQREGLLQREAALDQRLEARRERESRETIASIGRDAQVQAAQAQAQAQEAAPAYVMAWPRAAGPRLPHRGHRPLRNT